MPREELRQTCRGHNESRKDAQTCGHTLLQLVVAQRRYVAIYDKIRPAKRKEATHKDATIITNKNITTITTTIKDIYDSVFIFQQKMNSIITEAPTIIKAVANLDYTSRLKHLPNPPSIWCAQNACKFCKCQYDLAFGRVKHAKSHLV